MLKPPAIDLQHRIRRWKFFETEKFILELELSPLSVGTSFDVNSASDLYNSTLPIIFNKIISFKTVRLHERLLIYGLKVSVVLQKCLKRSLERIYMRTNGENEFSAWLGKNKLYKRLVRHKHKINCNN